MELEELISRLENEVEGFSLSMGGEVVEIRLAPTIKTELEGENEI